MSYYTLLDKKGAEVIARRYGLEFISHVPIEEGSENSNFLLQTREGQFVLTIFEVKERPEVERIARLLLHLKNNDYPAPRVQATQNGKLVSELDGKAIMIKAFIEGKTIAELSSHKLVQTGKVLARLHAIPSPEFLPREPAFGLEWMRSVQVNSKDAEFKIWLRQTRMEIENQLPSDLSKGLIQADLFTDNMLFNKNEFAAILDFEEACNYFLAFDIGMALLGCCRGKKEISDAKVSALLAGYQTVRALPRSEMDTLPLFVRYAAASTASWRYWKFNISKPNTKKQSKYMEMVSIADWAATLKQGYWADS